jgi:hypothetical protein
MQEQQKGGVLSGIFPCCFGQGGNWGWDVGRKKSCYV